MSQPKHQWRLFRLLLKTLAMLALVFTVYRVGLHWMVETKLEALRRDGLPTTLDELDAWYARPSMGDNAAVVYWSAFASQVADRERHAAVPLMGCAKLPPQGQPFDAETRRALAQYLSDNTDARRLLHEAAAKSQSRYPIRLTLGYGTRLPHLDLIKEAAILLALEGLQAADEGDSERASQSVLACLNLARSLLNEPLYMSQAVRMGHEGTAVALLERSLNRTAFTEEQLSRVSAALVATDNFHGMKRGLVGERLMGIDTFERPLFELEQTGLLGDLLATPSGRFVLFSYRLTGVFELDMLSFLDVMQDYGQILDGPLPECLGAAEALNRKIRALPSYCMLSRSVYPPSMLLRLEMKRIARTRCAVAALAVEHHRLLHGRLPDTLDELVPVFIQTVPQDPFDGKPLRYRQLAAPSQGYVVYSVGHDCDDNNGLDNGEFNLKAVGTDIAFTVER